MPEKLRLLICHDCQSIEELPDFKGRPDDDVLLAHLVQGHRFPNGEEHIGVLCDVEKSHWENAGTRAEIVARIGKKGATGFEAEFYATKQTFQDDALKCYDKHSRPKQGCIDYRNDEKRLGNPTKDGWRQGPKIFLCDFCPVKTWVMTEQRNKMGAYDS